MLDVGATHAFGGLLPTLAAARAPLAPSGRVLIGESYREAVPTPEAVDMLGEFTDAAVTLDRVTADGWPPVHGPDSAEALEAALRRSEWPRVHRDGRGFVGLVPRRTAG